MQYFNYTYQPSGTLWERRYLATVVDTENYLLTLMRYIELNLVRAGMVAHPRDHTNTQIEYTNSTKKVRHDKN